MVTLYGIKNCDTVKKARHWLESQTVAYRFHDFKGDGLSPEQLAHILQFCTWETLLNRRGTTWKKLGDAQKTELNEQTAINLLLAHPTLIKRPVLDTGTTILVGFNPSDYQAVLLN